LNDPDGRVKAVAAIIPGGLYGGVSVYNNTGSTNVILDVNGYFVASGAPNGQYFFPITPCRIADTRVQNNPVPALGAPSLVANSSRDFPILQAPCGVPATAQAYSLNFTVVPHGPLSYVTAYPTGQAQPLVSTLNDLVAQTIANAAIVEAGTNGDINVYATNDTDLVIDINGYFAPPGFGNLSFYVTPPCRLLDTRQSVPDWFIATMPVNAGGSACAPLSTAQAFVFNTTVIPLDSFGYLTLWPDATPQPLVSTLNALDGSVTNNMAIVSSINGYIDAFASAPTRLILDLFGYFAP